MNELTGKRGHTMNHLPKEPMILLSYMNTQLRDFYSSLDEFCDSRGVERAEIEAALAPLGYVYDSEKNQFV